jgi:hypothetical protein
MSITKFHGRVVFGGELSPIGWRVGFVERPLSVVRDTVSAWGDRGEVSETELALPVLDQLAELLPLEMPFTRRLLVDTRAGWTAHFDNERLGGDPQGWIGSLASFHDCPGVIASHVPRGQYPYPSTQFWLLQRGADGHWDYVRTVTAGVFDSGRWLFDTSGEVQPYEETDAYGGRLGRNRFTREMLLRYLAALGIDADNPDFYGPGVLYQESADWRRKTLTLDEARREYGWKLEG